jgi:hypothetical protein
LPPLKPTKRLEVLWKTAAKHFRDLALDESHIAMSIADRRGAVPTHVFTAGTHAQMTLQQVYDLLPPAPSPETVRLSGLAADCWARRLAGVIHLYFDLTEASRHKLRAAAAAKGRDAAASSGQLSKTAPAPAPIPPASSRAGASSGNGGGGGGVSAASKLRGAKAAGPGSLWRQKEVDRRKGKRILSSDAVTRPTSVSVLRSALLNARGPPPPPRNLPRRTALSQQTPPWVLAVCLAAQAPPPAASSEGTVPPSSAEGSALNDGARRVAAPGAIRPQSAQSAQPAKGPITDLERGAAPAAGRGAHDASGGEASFPSDPATHRQSMLMQASDVASTDVYAAADMPGGASSWSLLRACRGIGGHSSGDASLPLDQPRSSGQQAGSDDRCDHTTGTQAGPGVTPPPASVSGEAEPRRSFARLGSLLSSASGLGGASLSHPPNGSAQPSLGGASAQARSGSHVIGNTSACEDGSRSCGDGGASRGVTAPSLASALPSGGSRVASQRCSAQAPPLFSCGVQLGTAMGMSGPLPGAELSVGAVERMLFDERSQSLAHSEGQAGHAGKGGDHASTSSFDIPKPTREQSSLRFQLRLSDALKSVSTPSCQAEASSRQEEGRMIHMGQSAAAIGSDGQPTRAAPVAQTACLVAADAKDAGAAVDTPAQAQAPLHGGSTDDDDACAAESRPMISAQDTSDGLHGQACGSAEVADPSAHEEAHSALAAAADMLKPESDATAPPIPSAPQREEPEANATEQAAADSDAEAADDLAAMLGSESDSDEDDWEAEWNSAEQEVREEDQARAAAAEGSGARRGRSKSKEASPFKSPRKSPRRGGVAQEMQGARTPPSSRNRAGRKAPGTSERSAGLPSNTAVPPSSMPSPGRAQLSTHNGAPLPSDDSDDDRPVAELLSEWTRGDQALDTTASRSLAGKRPLAGGGAASSPKRGRSTSDFVQDGRVTGSAPLPPLSPITAPLDAELDAQLQSQGRELFLSGIANEQSCTASCDGGASRK